MSHYAVIAPPFYSHVRALEALADPLIRHGHQITFVLPARAASLVEHPDIAVVTVPLADEPPGVMQKVAGACGLSLLNTINEMARTTDQLCLALPGLLEKLHVDGIIADQMEAAGGLVAEARHIPFVSVACALPVNREKSLPLPVMPFAFARDKAAQKRYKTSEKIYDWLMLRHTRVINHHARRFGLSLRHGIHDCLSPLAQISQTFPAFDFPRASPPKGFHAVGPLRRTQEIKPSEVSWPVSTDRPFVFASLGTLQGHRFSLFKTIAYACRAADVQLLIAHCGGLSTAQSQALIAAGATWVTDFADQATVLRQAQVVITHAGLNTVADAIISGTPVLAIPLAFDQPGVAARVEWSGIGRKASRFCRPGTLTEHLRTLLDNPRYRERLAALRAPLQDAGGATAAADIIEQVLRPVRTAQGKAS